MQRKWSAILAMASGGTPVGSCVGPVAAGSMPASSTWEVRGASDSHNTRSELKDKTATNLGIGRNTFRGYGDGGSNPLRVPTNQSPLNGARCALPLLHYLLHTDHRTDPSAMHAPRHDS